MNTLLSLWVPHRAHFLGDNTGDVGHLTGGESPFNVPPAPQIRMHSLETLKPMPQLTGTRST